MKRSKLVLSMGVASLMAATALAQQNQNNQPTSEQRQQQQQRLQQQQEQQLQRQQQQTGDPSKIIGRTTTSAVAVGQPFLAIKASDLIGHEIHNEEGKEIGDVNDLLIDLQQGRVAGVTVGVGGILGIGEQNRVVPMKAISCEAKDHADAGDRSAVRNNRDDAADDLATDRARNREGLAGTQRHEAKDRVLVLNMDEKLRTSQTTAENVNSYQSLEQVYRDYQQTPYWKDQGQDRQQVRQQDRDNQAAATSFQIRKAEDLMGTEIHNQSDENIGEIQDFVIDLQTARIVYVTVTAGGFAGIGDNLVAIPPSQFKPGKDDKVMLNMTEERLKSAPKFNKDEWPDLNDPTWVSKVYGYYGETEYWSADPSDLQQNQRNNSDTIERQRVRESEEEKP